MSTFRKNGPIKTPPPERWRLPLNLSLKERVRLAGRLYDMRHRLRESQEQFGSRFGLTRSGYTAWERSGPPTDQACLFAVLLMRRLADREKWRWAKRQQARQRAAVKAAHEVSRPM